MISINISDIINIVLCILSFVLALISVVTVVITLRQNSEMIENSARPYITIYGKKVNFGNPEYILIIKNFGASGATIKNFHSNIQLSKYACGNGAFNNVCGLHLAPQQSVYCSLNIDKLNLDNIKELPFEIEYFGIKNYTENVVLNFLADTENALTSTHNQNNELKVISTAIQQMGKRML